MNAVDLILGVDERRPPTRRNCLVSSALKSGPIDSADGGVTSGV